MRFLETRLRKPGKNSKFRPAMQLKPRFSPYSSAFCPIYYAPLFRLTVLFVKTIEAGLSTRLDTITNRAKR